MRSIVIILGGVGDRKCQLLGNKTPLEAAKTPNLDWLAKRSYIGTHEHKIKGIPHSDEATLAIFGNKPEEIRRGIIEAVGAGVKFNKGDLALRADFATIDFKTGKIVDRRVGRTLTTKEARILSEEVNKKVKMPFEFQFRSTVQHRGVLVFYGNFSQKITDTDPEYWNHDSKAHPSHPTTNEESAKYTAHWTNIFLKEAFKILRNHRINKKRIEKGLLPANGILLRGAGNHLPELNHYPGWISVNYMPVERGTALLSGMKSYSFEYPDFSGSDVYENLHEGLKKACHFSLKILKNNPNNNFFYIHIKETDIPGHDGNPYQKKKMIEEIDQLLISGIKEIVEKNKIKLLITGDHATPSELKGHSKDPVPLLFYESKVTDIKEKEQRFTEDYTKKGKIKKINALILLKKLGFR